MSKEDDPTRKDKWRKKEDSEYFPLAIDSEDYFDVRKIEDK